MNANEMADLMIQFDSGRIYEHAEEIANMLRKQQEEIEYWKEKFDKAMEIQQK
jgi:predicted ATP-grasp superfamily ATP-dependent carboligase